MMRLAIISDTHNHLPDAVLPLISDCGAIIHAGDICEPNILWQLEAVAPVTAVLGNNDYLDFGPSVLPTASVVFEGVRFVVAHEPPALKRTLASAQFDNSIKPIVAIHGHTHVPKLIKGNATEAFEIMICPGSVFRSREEMGRRTLAKVEVEDGAIITAKIFTLDGEEILGA